MKISRRAQAIAPFFAMEFGKRAASLAAQGHDIVKLNIGEPDFGAPPAVIKAMQEVVSSCPLPYTSAVGLPVLREAIAGFYKTAHDVEVDPARVVVTAGASAALLLVTAALVDPGDEWIVGDPSYPCNRQFLASFGATVNLIPTTAATRFQLDAAAVRSAWTAKTRGLMVATPSNPVGTSVPPSELAAICDCARQHGAWRIIDEIYLNLSYGKPDGRPLQSVLSIDSNAIVINSFSKYFGMTGWRLGWCIVPSEMIPVMERLAQNYYICPSTPAQHAALTCFTRECIAVCEDRCAELARRRAVVLERLASLGLPVPAPPDGAFYVYIDVSRTGLNAWRFCERALDEAHVALTPGNDFGHCSADAHVRLSYAASIGALEEGFRRLERFVSDLSAPRQ